MSSYFKYLGVSGFIQEGCDNKIMTKKIFIENVKMLCKEHNIKFVLSKRRLKLYGGQIDGVYVAGELLYIYNGKNYFLNLVHELSHMLQHIYKTKHWKLITAEECNLFESGEHNKKLIKKIQNVELEAEKIAVQLIKQFKLPINLDKYIMKANILIFSYTHTYQTGKHCMLVPDNLNYNIPKKFLKTYDKIPNCLFETFNELSKHK